MKTLELELPSQLTSKALITGRRVGYFAYRNALKKHGVDPQMVNILRKCCPLCGGIA